jgi:hypothetical protein
LASGFLLGHKPWDEAQGLLGFGEPRRWCQPLTLQVSPAWRALGRASFQRGEPEPNLSDGVAVLTQVTTGKTAVMTHHTRPHAYIPGGSALTDASIDELIRPGLHQAFPLPSGEDATEAKFRGLLSALAQRSSASVKRLGRAP